jgi:hypothetical protein
MLVAEPDEQQMPEVHFITKETVTSATGVNKKYGVKIDFMTKPRATGKYCDFGEWAVANWRAFDVAGN